jgi:alpha-beta hydrolase superfamily lysophospholipase
LKRVRHTPRRWFRTGFWVLLLLVAVVASGPRPDLRLLPEFGAELPRADLDAWLVSKEAGVAGLRPGLGKQIVWAEGPGQVTSWSLVYVHGFSASKAELRPVPDQIAERCHANLFFTRLAGHGVSGEALAEATMQQWIDDVVESVEVGRLLGERVVLMGTSTGATLVTWAALQPELREHIAAVVLVAPNFAIQGAPTWLLNFPWMEWVLPELLGQQREWQPRSAADAEAWTTRYPTKAIFPMAALLRVAEQLPYEAATQPALFVYSALDTVVDPAATRDVIGRWGNRVSILRIDQSEDVNHHVIAGEIRSPSTTAIVVDEVIHWLQQDVRLDSTADCAASMD